jgi:ABC-type glycerol-3-phosphate transport system substrate-binding protein
MQWKSAKPGKLSRLGKLIGSIALAVVLASGCSDSSAPPPAAKNRQPFAGVKVKVGCADPRVAVELARRAGPWSQRTGAAATVEPGLPADADVVVIPPRELGAWVAKNDAKPVPEEIRGSTHPLQWPRLLTISAERLAGWGGDARAIPLAGEAYVLIYRADRFADPKAAPDYAAKYGRPLAPPATWEEFADVAEFFADRGQPSLPAPAEQPHRALREFHMVAACYDRLVVGGTTATAERVESKSDTSAAEMLAFHHAIDTGEPRLRKPAFVEAARWVKRTARCRAAGPGDNPAAAVATGPAVLAVVSLAELGRLPKEGAAAPPTIGVAPLPGTKVWFDPKDGQPKPPGDKVKGVNYIPYFGEGGWVAVVRNSCQNPDAAFDLLSDLSGLSRSAELLSEPALGFGPFRAEHLDEAREAIWQRYGFDAERSRQLASAIRHYVGIGMANQVVAPRGADQQELMTLLASEVRKVGTGAASPEDAMKAADAAWRKADAARPADALRAERRQAAGLR